MKIRNGFVSNSSSSSFLIYGICMGRDEMMDALNISEEVRESDDFDEYEFFGNDGLEVNSPYGEDIFVGRSWSEVGDNQTGLQFKKEVYEKLKTVLPELEESSLGTHEYAWHD
jgi:hypothetical protein